MRPFTLLGSTLRPVRNVWPREPIAACTMFVLQVVRRQRPDCCEGSPRIAPFAVPPYSQSTSRIETAAAEGSPGLY
ncbi:MAG: hypothetical protein ACOZQL_35380 [Myxococcota bacterium]